MSRRLPEEPVVDARAHDVVAFVDGAVEARIRIALVAEINVEVLGLHAPGGSKHPLDTSTRGPSDQSARRLERRPGTGGWQAGWAQPSRRELGFTISEAGSDVPE